MGQDRSILNSIKKLLGISANYNAYDTDVIVFINSAFVNLMQFGVGPSNGFSITGETERWEDFLDDRKDLESVITYVYLKVRLVFDPPQSGFLIDAIKNQLLEIEWRLNIQVETINNTALK